MTIYIKQHSQFFSINNQTTTTIMSSSGGSSINFNNILFLNTDVLNLFTKLAKKHQDDEKSCIFDVSSVLQVLKLAVGGFGNKTEASLTDLKNMIKMAPKLDNKNSRSAVLIRNHYNFTQKYMDEFNNEAILDNIPTKPTELDRINKIVHKKYPDNYYNRDNFLENPIDISAFLVIINENSFEGKWETPFSYIEDATFYVNSEEEKTIEIPMLNINNEPRILIKTFKDETINSLVVALNYTNEYKMLIIRPDEPKTKKQLIELCETKLNGPAIQNIIDKFENVNYTDVSMPQFSFQTNWDLKEAAGEIPYLKTLFDGSTMDYSNLSPDMVKGQSKLTSLTSRSNITNDKYGTRVESRSELLGYDSHVSKRNRLDLNSPFIFMVMNDENKIHNVGLFVG